MTHHILLHIIYKYAETGIYNVDFQLLGSNFSDSVQTHVTSIDNVRDSTSVFTDSPVRVCLNLADLTCN